MEDASSLSEKSEIDDDESHESQIEAPPKDKPRGRPVGKPDTTQRYRRTAQEISDDKIKVVQMKLDAMKEAEALKMSNKKPRRPLRDTAASISKRVSEEPLTAKRGRDAEPMKVPLSSSRVPAHQERDEDSSPSPSISREGRRPPAHRRQSLYDSWFPPSPRTMR